MVLDLGSWVSYTTCHTMCSDTLCVCVCVCIGVSEGGFVGVPSYFGKAVLLGFIPSAFSIPPIKIIYL
ncbi:hypothetical protein PanWU01x14_145940 [Parasponia andersonii]|uniref:Uncharacterized protein n=1 Tax=Parasponia andersonii TaxID=3476 RepID=A0A2P5CKC2_PARAD|nr:hypothetical protein PanWU01x14_145940 [Parasponia andersonii]